MILSQGMCLNVFSSLILTMSPSPAVVLVLLMVRVTHGGDYLVLATLRGEKTGIKDQEIIFIMFIYPFFVLQTKAIQNHWLQEYFSGELFLFKFSLLDILGAQRGWFRSEILWNKRQENWPRPPRDYWSDSFQYRWIWCLGQERLDSWLYSVGPRWLHCCQGRCYIGE